MDTIAKPVATPMIIEQPQDLDSTIYLHYGTAEARMFIEVNARKFGNLVMVDEIKRGSLYVSKVYKPIDVVEYLRKLWTEQQSGPEWPEDLGEPEKTREWPTDLGELEC